MKDIVREYLHQMEKQLPCPRAIREPFLRQLKDELEHFCSRNPEADANMLAQCFGSPEAVAHEFLVETTPEAFVMNFQKRSKLLIAGISIVLLALSVMGLMTKHRPATEMTSAESQVIASIVYTREDGKQSKQVADIFISADIPPQQIENEIKPWYNYVNYGSKDP